MKQVKKTDLNAIFLFISPPSLEELRRRLEGRKSESTEKVNQRLATALVEIEYAKTGPHDYILVNDDIESSYSAFEQIALGKEGNELKAFSALTDSLPPFDT